VKLQNTQIHYTMTYQLYSRLMMRIRPKRSEKLNISTNNSTSFSCNETINVCSQV